MAAIHNALVTGARATLTPYIINSNQTNLTITISSLAGYVSGLSDITITINSSIYVYSTSTSTPALTITGAAAGDKITLVNNGFIMGMGGDGGDMRTTQDTTYPGAPGGPALSIYCNLRLDTSNGYIGGGGGGGGAGPGGFGGGGAGGGRGGGRVYTGGYLTPGGEPGQAGSSSGWGVSSIWGGNYGPFAAGGGGGRIMPGTGGVGVTITYTRVDGHSSFYELGKGGGSGGSGGTTMADQTNSKGGNGGSGSNAGQNGLTIADGGGGGGWGAAGGSAGGTIGPYLGQLGGAGGKAIVLNGYSVTYVGSTTGRIFGAVS